MAKDRRELIAAVSDQGRVTAMRSALFHVVVAARAGINVTDFNCLAVLDKEGPMTPHELAERIGLTRGGAITAAIDRLERAGYASRRRDATDRRRVLVELVREGPYQDLLGFLEGVDRAYAELAAGYSDEELAVVHDFALRANELIDEQTRRLRDQPP
ncbi:MarR family transcriptional regulator [Nonomuraea phyllanthi]|uniref:MarR family transcriptional regulator n=1 Tax=Nonomuraea phyllanthi TaxID=2219224 RepID=A0A5C4VIJ3_9ACTN|nr:MarR family transcriptional regulator [Nonomuraea phyllanthi]KAB8191074.1 MarR family transcriptional regulator [Nonomuraea phyllanthi]QFY12867.1 MarR family transcriptional regulator [Nonomuraea phyllanthi]